ncbi:MAG: glutaredoxin 3 [Alphaproteobacteria bacterium]|nr:glutaredoxin 3 [Alphaproteobacteria bacterium]
MPHIVVYSGPNCPYCWRAKQLLKHKGAPFTEIDVRADSAALAEMLAKSQGKQTIPQIFIDDKHVGGCDDLYALDQAGQLDPLLQT